MNANAPTAGIHASETAALVAQREGRRRGEQAQARLGAVARGEQARRRRRAAPRSSPPATRRSARRRERGGGARPVAASANGRSSSVQPSGVAQRSQPSRDVSATTRSEEERAEHRAAELRARSGGRRELARDRADADEHRRRRRRSRARGTAEPPTARPRDDEPGEQRRARGATAPAPIAGERREEGRRAAHRPGEHELLPARRPPRRAAPGPPRGAPTCAAKIDRIPPTRHAM